MKLNKNPGCERRKEPREALILEDILNKAINSKSENLAVFGIRDYIVTLSGRHHDLFFHLAENIPVEVLGSGGPITSPVLTYQKGEDETFLKIYEAHSRNKNLSTFAVKTQSEDHKLLAFYDVYSDSMGGTRISSRGSITVTNESELKRIIGNWDYVKNWLDKLKEEIDKHYHPTAL